MLFVIIRANSLYYTKQHQLTRSKINLYLQLKQPSVLKSCAKTQLGNYRHLNVATLIRVQNTLFSICCRQSGTHTGCSSNTFLFPRQYLSTSFPHPPACILNRSTNGCSHRHLLQKKATLKIKEAPEIEEHQSSYC